MILSAVNCRNRQSFNFFRWQYRQHLSKANIPNLLSIGFWDSVSQNSVWYYQMLATVRIARGVFLAGSSPKSKNIMLVHAWINQHGKLLMSLRLNHICQLTLFTAAITLTTACSVNPVTSKPASFGSAWQSVDCKTFDVPDAIAAKSDCGYVTVPEQHAQPNGPTIQLAVVRTRSSGKNPALDPLFVE